MREVLRRIAIHGALAAIVLALIGFMLAELASIWLAGSPGVRASTGESIGSTDTDGAIGDELKSRMPYSLAAWGFAFVAVGEVALYYWRRLRKPVPPPPQKHDEAEQLLEEILRQVESQKSQSGELTSPFASSVENPTPESRV